MRWAFISLMILTGCIRLPRDEMERCMLDPPALEKTGAIAQESGLFASSEEWQANWWEMFEDCQLSNLIQQALCHNPSLKAAEARVRRAQEEAKVQRASLYPTVGFTADVNFQNLAKNGFFRAYAPMIPARVDEYFANLNFTYQLDFWGKNRNLTEAMVGFSHAEECELYLTRLYLSTFIAQNYFIWQAEREKLFILNEQSKLLQKALELTEDRKKSALDNVQVVLDARQSLTEMEKLILATQNNLVIQEHTLKMLVALGPDDELCLRGIPLPKHIIPSLPSDLSCNLLARRPDLKAQIWRVEALAHLVGAAKADFYPSINLMGLAGLDSVFVNKLFTGKSITETLTPALNLPIFTAGRIRANLRAREAEFQEAIQNYNDMLLGAAREVADQITAFQTADGLYRLQESVVEDRMSQQNLSSDRYNVGISALFDLLQAQGQLLAAQLALIDLALSKSSNAIALVKALGGGYHD